MRFALRGTLAVDAGPRAGAVVVEDGRIADVLFGDKARDLAGDVRDAAWVAPGLVDWQVNGAAGVDLAGDAEAIGVVARWLPSTGVTSFLPTLVSAPLDLYQRAAGWVAAHRGGAAAGARVLGLHLEGPFLAPERAGAHDPDVIAAAERDAGLFDALLALDGLRLVTLAPERPGALERIRRLRAAGVAVSLGHTAADHDQMRAGIDAGAALVTHLYNAMTGFSHRAPGAVGAALTDDRVTLGIIADGVHSHPASLTLAVRAAGAARIALATDAMAAAGMAPGRYQLAGREVIADGASARLADGTLAGSTLTMDRAVRNLVALCGVSPADALRMASSTAARALGLEGVGELRRGAIADLVLLDHHLAIEATYIGGTCVYER